MEDLKCLFRDPSSEYRGVALWFQNDRLEKEECLRHLESVADGGWGRVIPRVYVGLRTVYQGPEWIDIVRASIARAKELDLRVWLQEMDKNGASYAPSTPPGMPREFWQIVLVRKAADASLDQGERVVASSGDSVFCRKSIFETLPSDSFLRHAWIPNLLNAEAVSYFLQEKYQELVDVYGDELGRGVEAIWIDEPMLGGYHCPRTFLPWTDELPGVFEKSWGYSVFDVLPQLFSDQGDYRGPRAHYWRTVVECFRENYFRPTYEWCDSHGVKCTGHLMGEDKLHDQIRWSGSIMPFYEYFHIPGIDHLSTKLERRPNLSAVMLAKQASSMANQLGRREVLAELYGTSSQGTTFEDRKRLGEWFYICGINYRCYHGSFYSMGGARKRYHPPNLSRQQPYWPDTRRISDYFARLSVALRQGHYATDVLMLHPIESAHCLYTPGEESRAIHALHCDFALLSQNLLATGIPYDYGDESFIERNGAVKDGRLQVGDMSYAVVVLPSLVTIREQTVTFLESLLDHGGAVISAGTFPELVDGRPDERLVDLRARVASVGVSVPALRETLLALHTPVVTPDVSDEAAVGTVLTHSRVLEDGSTLHFVVNTAEDQSVDLRLRFAETGLVEKWDLETGSVEPVAGLSDSEQTMALSLVPLGSTLLHLTPGVTHQTCPPAPETHVESRIAVPGPYSLSLDSPNTLPLDYCCYRKGEEEWSPSIPVIGLQEMLVRESYQGSLEVEYEFFCNTPPEQCWLALEHPEEAEIVVNDAPVDSADEGPFRDICFRKVAIHGRARQGRNTVVLRTQFVPPNRASGNIELYYGTELEAIYVVGDFSVRGAVVTDGGKGGAIRLSPHLAIDRPTTETSGDLVADGLPFYCGRATLVADVVIPAVPEGVRAVLEPCRLHAVVAHVSVNGVEAGSLAWRPHRIDVTAACRPGANRIEIECVNSLRNLLGPLHRTEGDSRSVWGYDFTARYSEGSGWLDKREKGELTTWTDDYFVVPFGVSGGMSVKTVRS